jgi:hypothetical protein
VGLVVVAVVVAAVTARHAKANEEEEYTRMVDDLDSFEGCVCVYLLWWICKWEA